MALVRIPEERRVIDDAQSVASFLEARGVLYERWQSERPIPQGATADVVLQTWADKIDELKARDGYTTADVVDLTPATPGLDAMVAKFNREHWHHDDEVRFIVEGRGLFFISPPSGPVFAIEALAGDLIRVPRGARHWFDLCADRRVLAIRLFQDPSGWTPHYTDSGIDRNYPPASVLSSDFPREGSRQSA